MNSHTQLLQQPARYQNWIGGRWLPAQSEQTFSRTSPSHEVVVGEYALSSAVEVDAAVAAARQAFEDGRWSQRKGAERAELLRKVAEFQNYRRRTQQEKEQLVELGKAAVIEQLLDPIDDLQRTLDASEESAEGESGAVSELRSLKDGVGLVHRKFLDELKRLGVHPIEAVGEAFDESLHEAVMQQPADEDVEPGTIVHEVRRGYRMGDRVIRHSRVVVAGG